MKGKTYEIDVDIAAGGGTTSTGTVPSYVVSRYVTALIVDNTSGTTPNRITLEEYDSGSGSVVSDQSFPISSNEGQSIGEGSEEELFQVQRGNDLRVTGGDSADVQLILQDEK